MHRLKRYQTFIERAVVETDLTQIKNRTQEIKDDFQSFKRIQASLEFLDSKDATSHYDFRSDFEELYYDCTAKADSILNENQINFANSTIIHRNPPNDESHESHIKLPTMHLPKFSGSPNEDWTSFMASFRTSIHENPKFSNTQKLLYLRTCLTDRAAEKIESLEMTDANYTEALKILEKSYYDPATLINKRVKAFFDLPMCTKLCATSIGNILDEATKHYRALQALKKPFLEAFPVYVVTSKLDESTRQKWKEFIQNQATPTMDDLLDFLHNRKRIIDSDKPDKTDIKKMNNISSSRNISNKSDLKNDKKSESRPNASYSVQTKTPFCNLCKAAHFTSTCEKLQDATPSERIQLVKNAKLCINCLRANHMVNACRATKCKKCNKAHHTILHLETNNPEEKPLTEQYPLPVRPKYFYPRLLFI